jgi:hypothetical protein
MGAMQAGVLDWVQHGATWILATARLMGLFNLGILVTLLCTTTTTHAVVRILGLK